MSESKMYRWVPPIAPKGPQLSLLISSLAPPSDDALDNDRTNAAGSGVTLPPDLAAELDNDGAELWKAGLAYAPYNQSAPINRAPSDVTTVDNPLIPPNLAPVYCQPWDVGTKYSLSALSWDAENFIDRATQQNDTGVDMAIEQEFWDGTLAQANGWPNHYLTDGGAYDVTPTPGTAVSIAAGLGLLQDALRHVNVDASGFSGKSLGGQGMIHCIPAAAPNLLQVRLVGKYMLDLFGNIIVPGVGYSGTGPFAGAMPSTTAASGTGATTTLSVSATTVAMPAGTTFSIEGDTNSPPIVFTLADPAAVGATSLTVDSVSITTTIADGALVAGAGSSTSWMYATDLVVARVQKKVRTFPSSFAEATNRQVNLITFRAERFACAYWDNSRHFCVLVNLPS